MKIKQYNFINGKVNSGKSLFTRKLCAKLLDTTIYYYLDFDSSLYEDLIPSKNITTITIQNPNLNDILKQILHFNETIFTERWTFVFDSINNLTGLYEFIQALPKNHRYFFVRTINSDFNNLSTGFKSPDFDTINFLEDEYLFPRNSVSLFDVFKDKNKNTQIYNHNSNQTYNISEIEQVIRDIKINQLINDTSP